MAAFVPIGTGRGGLADPDAALPSVTAAELGVPLDARQAFIDQLRRLNERTKSEADAEAAEVEMSCLWWFCCCPVFCPFGLCCVPVYHLLVQQNEKARIDAGREFAVERELRALVKGTAEHWAGAFGVELTLQVETKDAPAVVPPEANEAEQDDEALFIPDVEYSLTFAKRV